jgi:hypothetical protein
LLIENHPLGFSINIQLKNQQLLRVCEEARDRRHGESSLPPAAVVGDKKGEQPCLV